MFDCSKFKDALMSHFMTAVLSDCLLGHEDEAYHEWVNVR